MKRVIKNQKKMKNAMYIVFGAFALALFAITRMHPSYANEGLMIDDALDAIVLYGEVETSTEDENLDESQDEEEEISEVDNEEDVDGVQNEDIPLMDNEGDDDSQNVSDNEEDVDETGDEILNSDNTDNEENKQEEKGEDEKGNGQPETQNPEVPATEEIHGVDDNTPENAVEEDKTQDTDNSKTSEYEQSEIGDFIKDSDTKEIFTTNSTYTIVNQVREEWPNNGLKNFEYGMISIARPSSLSSSDYPIEGFTIMDRNLGATMTGVGRTNQKAYGYHYQWGNNYGFDSSKSTGEMLISSTQVNVSGLTEYTGSTFIKGHETWMKSANNNLWMEGGQGPCPEGWHMPTSEELGNLYKYYTNTYTDGYPRFQNYFYLPIAGKRYYYNGELVIYDYGNYYGYLRSSSPHWSSNSYGVGAYFAEGYNNFYYGVGEYRAQGLSIRCFKNSYAGDTSNFHRINFDYKGGVGSTALVNVINGGTGTKPSDPIKNHSIFSGWYLSGTDTEFDFTSTTINEDIYLHAKWKCEDGYQVKGNSCVEPYYTDTYTIAFNTDGGSDKESIVVPGGVPMINAKFSHTSNIDDNGVQHGDFALNQNTNEVVKIDGADRLKIKIIYETPYNYYHYAVMWEGSHPEYTAQNDYSLSKTSKLGGERNIKQYSVDGDTVTFGFRSDSSYYDYYGYKKYGYYAIVEDVEPYFVLGDNPTKEGKAFDGWYKENGEEWNKYTDIVDGDITLYAHWKEPEAILLPGKEFNCKLKNLAENSSSTSCYGRSNYSINNIVRAESIPSGVKKVEIQSEDSNYPIYAWYKNGTIYIYSESDIIYMNPDSSYMFYYMYSLKNFDANAFDTSKVESMSYMFGYCYAIDDINLSDWNVENVKNTSYMFYYAYGLKDLDLSDWKTNSLENTSYMFNYAQALKNLNLSGWNTTKFTNMSYMFYYCTTLETLNLDGWDFSNSPNVSSMFYGLNSLKFLSMREWKIPNQLYNGFYSSFSMNNSYALETIDVTNWDLTNTTSLYQLFYELYSLKEIIGLDTWDTSNIENMYYTFGYLYNVESLDVGSWDTSNVTNMYSLFYNCRSIEELDLSGWDTSKVQSMSSMFQECRSLKKINLDGWDFRSAVNGMYMFGYGTRDLEEIGMKNWKFSGNVVNFACNMNLGCHGNSPNQIKEIDVSGWTFSGDSLYDLFYAWYSLEKIEGLDTWDVSNIKNMGNMFYGTYNLKDVDFSGWNTSNVTNMYGMFYNASGLVELDLSSFDTSNVTGMSNMFYNASNLNTIYVSDKFDATNLLSGDNMFSGTTSIVGGNGTVYDPLKFNQEYAKIDTLSQSGYFTNVLDKPYTITYNLDEGVISGEKTIYTQRDTFTLVTPIKTGYTFLGWTGSNGVIPQTGVNVQSGTVKGNLEYTANWEINQYTITFDTDGGNEINPISVDYNSVIQNLPTPTKECNEFLGWDAELPDRMPAYDITLKAVWNYTCSKSSGGGGGGGGGGSSKPTNENKNIHNSADEEQKSEETSNQESLNQETSEQENTKEETLNQNTSTEEKSETIVSVVDVKTETAVANISTSNDSSYTPEQKQSYEFAKANGITTTSSIEQAKMNTSLKRIEMAKMLSQYAINVLGQEPDSSKGIIKFNDVTNKLDKEYDNGVTLAYQLGIMGQNMKDNNFRPNDEVTRAEFVTALSRLLYNTDEGKYKGTGKYYEPHMAKLYNEGIISKTDPKIKEKRGYVMIMLMRSVK